MRRGDNDGTRRWRADAAPPDGMPHRFVGRWRKLVRRGLGAAADFSYGPCYEDRDGPIAQLDRVTDFYSVGCRFESCWDRHLPIFSMASPRDQEARLRLAGRTTADLGCSGLPGVSMTISPPFSFDRSSALIRDCQPAPELRSAAITSWSSRSLTGVFGLASRGRPLAFELRKKLRRQHLFRRLRARKHVFSRFGIFVMTCP